MLLAVVSDSHLGAPASWLERVYARHLAGADLLLHCGDVTGRSTWAYFLQHPNFHAARGNCDWDLAEELAPLVRLDVEGFRLALTHGFGDRPGVARRLARELAPLADIVCFGHTHRRHFAEDNGLVLLNPGSLAEGSLALLELAPGRAPSCTFVDVDTE